MLIAIQVVLILFFIFNMGKLIYDYMDDIREVKFINMIYVIGSIAVLVFINFIIS